MNPWATGSRFIVSHRLLTDEVYAAGLRDVLGEFRTRALFVLDEAHHAAPAAGIRYAISSQLTKAVRELGERFEHRLFLTATPHNGHSNSFSALLEMLDPQRFTRGVEVRPKDLEPVMVRRLKADLRRLGEAFPERVIEAVRLDGLPEDTPELALARQLATYGEMRMRRITNLPPQKASMAKLAFVGLQQRLLSSVAAFARTLKVHRATLQRRLDGEEAGLVAAAALAFVGGPGSEDSAELGLEDERAEKTIDADDDATAEAASALGVADAPKGDMQRRTCCGRRHVGYRRALPVAARRQGALVDRLDQSQPSHRPKLESPASHHFHGIRRHAAVARTTPERGGVGHGSCGRSNWRLHRRNWIGSKGGCEASVQRGSRR